MMCSIKKPVKSTVRQYVCRMETLNKYLGMLPTIKKSPMAVASTELGNVPFTKATHASIILSHLPVAWRNQYDLTHKTVPESPRAMLLDLENIKKMQVETYNEKAKASKAKAASVTAELRVPKKRANGGGADKGASKKGRTAKYCKWCKAVNGSFTTHDTAECRRFEKDGSQKDRLVKIFDSVKKPWKKTGGKESSQMAYLTERLLKLEKASKPLYNLIIGKQSVHDIGAVLDFKEKTITIDSILLPMRNIVNLQLKPSVTRALRHNTSQAQELGSTRNATKRAIEILDA
jgi:hypothetical protein